MNHLEKFKALLADAEIQYDIEIDNKDIIIRLHAGDRGETTKITGYSGFFCEWVFDELGELTTVGIWE